MSPRATRIEQSAENRERVLDAARDVFRAKGFRAASVDEIADAAGFSKGVVYSQFGSKADLFLALLERRIEERARQNRAVVARATGGGAVLSLWQLGEQVHRADPDWTLLVLEFRVYAARDPELRGRYAELHARSLAGVAEVIELICAQAGVSLTHSAEDVARLAFALGNGYVLEDFAAPRGTTSELVPLAFARLLGLPADDQPRRD